MQEYGVILVLAAFFAVVLVGLCALVLGLGLVSAEKSDMQRAANAAALAAVEKWASGSREVEEIEERAKFFIEENKIRAQSAEDKKLEVTVELGVFHPRYSQELEDTCGSESADNYPCLRIIPAPTAEDGINAARVKVSTTAGNKIIAPFAGIFGKAFFDVSSEATATLVQRCVAFLLDVSISTAWETHRPPAGNAAKYDNQNPEPEHEVYDIRRLNTQPLVPGLFAYKSAAINGEGASWFCRNDSQLAQPAYVRERSAWCATRWYRDGHARPAPLPQGQVPPWDGSPLTPVDLPWGGVPGYPAALPTVIPAEQVPDNRAAYGLYHYRYSDYIPRKTIYGYYFVDSYVDEHYRGPEPLATFLHAFHSGLTTLESQKTNQDLVMAKAFTGRVADSIPFSPGLTADIGYLKQVTNIENRGTFTYDEWGEPESVSEYIKPNIYTHGWFPVAGLNEEQGGSNLVGALHQTINELSEWAPRSCKKIIVLATDGVSTCQCPFNDPIIDCNWSDGICPELQQYSYYHTAKAQLIGAAPDEGEPFSAKTYSPSILDRLIENEISLTVLLAGEYVEPNFLNIERPGGQGLHRSLFLDYLEAVALGYSSPFGAFFDTSYAGPGISSNKDAFNLAGIVDGVKFRDPNGVLGKMAMDSGGLWCPLQERAAQTCYDSEGWITDECRQSSPTFPTQVHSIINQSKPIIAAQCVSNAVGFNPYMLAEPAQVIY